VGSKVIWKLWVVCHTIIYVLRMAHYENGAFLVHREAVPYDIEGRRKDAVKATQESASRLSKTIPVSSRPKGEHVPIETTFTYDQHLLVYTCSPSIESGQHIYRRSDCVQRLLLVR